MPSRFRMGCQSFTDDPRRAEGFTHWDEPTAESQQDRCPRRGERIDRPLTGTAAQQTSSCQRSHHDETAAIASKGQRRLRGINAVPATKRATKARPIPTRATSPRRPNDRLRKGELFRPEREDQPGNQERTGRERWEIIMDQLGLEAFEQHERPDHPSEQETDVRIDLATRPAHGDRRGQER